MQIFFSECSRKLSNNLAHLQLFIIQTYCGIKLGEGSRGGVSVAVHVRTAGTTSQLLPAAVALSLLNSRWNSGKKMFSFRVHNDTVV